MPDDISLAAELPVGSIEVGRSLPGYVAYDVNGHCPDYWRVELGSELYPAKLVRRDGATK
jgi:hypothetical protein